MPLLEKAATKKRTRGYRQHNRAVWITAIVLGSIMILGAILLACMDDYSWLIEKEALPSPPDSIHL